MMPLSVAPFRKLLPTNVRYRPIVWDQVSGQAVVLDSPAQLGITSGIGGAFLPLPAGIQGVDFEVNVNSDIYDIQFKNTGAPFAYRIRISDNIPYLISDGFALFEISDAAADYQISLFNFVPGDAAGTSFSLTRGVTLSSHIQVGDLHPDAVASNGMIRYVSSTGRFQGFASGNWFDFCPPPILPSGTVVNSTLFWGGSSYTENTTIKAYPFGNLVLSNSGTTVFPYPASSAYRENIILGEGLTFAGSALVSSFLQNVVVGLGHQFNSTGTSPLTFQGNFIMGANHILTDINAGSNNLSLIFSFGDGNSFNQGAGGTTAGLYMHSLGLQNSQSGFISTTIGSQLINNYSRSLVIGSRNVDKPAVFGPQGNWSWDSHPVFTVGNGAQGSSGTRSDAMVVYSSATIEIGHARNVTLANTAIGDATTAPQLGTMTNRLGRIGTDLHWQAFGSTIPYGPQLTIPAPEWTAFQAEYPTVAQALSSNLGKRIVTNTA